MRTAVLMVDTGRLLDVVTEVAGKRTYETGDAREIVEARVARDPEGWRHWSNGYIQLRPETADQVAAASHEFCLNPLHPGPCKGWKNSGSTVVKKAAAPRAKKKADKVAAVEPGAAVAITPRDAAALQRQMTAKKPWTAKQAQALADYSESWYSPINRLLRAQNLGPYQFQDVGPKIYDMMDALRPLPESVKLHRRVDLRGFGAGDIPADQVGDFLKNSVGKTFQEPGFMSTSINDAGFSGPQGRIDLLLDTPAGTPAAYLESVSENPREYEMLLPPGTKFRVTSVTSDGDNHTVRAQVEPA